MPLRLLEAIIPEERLDEIQELLAADRVVELGAVKLSAGRVAVRALVPVELVEQFSDGLHERFADSTAFRVVLASIEATMPAVPEPDDEDSAADEPSTEAHPGRVSREELYDDISESAKSSTVYVVTVAISTIVAAIGLLRGDVAVIVGAMVIAPLLGPNVALALAATLGDTKLGWRALKTIAIGVGVAAATSVAVGMSVAVDPSVEAIFARTRVGVGDVVLALAAGTAGALAVTRAVAASLIGVMVAVALLPPLVTAGLLAGSGYGELASGALLLVVTNVVCINIAGIGTFLAQNVGPRTWWEADRAKRATTIAISVWIALLIVLLLIMLTLDPSAP